MRAGDLAVGAAVAGAARLARAVVRSPELRRCQAALRTQLPDPVA